MEVTEKIVGRWGGLPRKGNIEMSLWTSKAL